MKAARTLAVLAGMVLAFTVLQYVANNYGAALPFLGIVLQIAAVGLPAFFGAGLAQRWGLPQPTILAVAGYCLGSGIAISIGMGGGETPARYVTVALVNALSLTILGPEVRGGFMPLWGDLLWLIAAYLIAREGASAVGKPRPLPPGVSSVSEDPQ